MNAELARDPQHKAVLVLNRLRVQNANTVSSPLTWGFPAVSAFIGFMFALERELGSESGVSFHGVGVICHHFEQQVSESRYETTFNLTRNPLMRDGTTASIAEEGRVHLEITLIFDLEISSSHLGSNERSALFDRIYELASGMRIAGGSIIPNLPDRQRILIQGLIELVPELAEEQRKQTRRVFRACLPGFALILRQDLLSARLKQMRSTNDEVTTLDAWLDLSRQNIRAIDSRHTGSTDIASHSVEWLSDPRPGWLVPISVGYTAISELYDPGTVVGARSKANPVRFVEPVWSIGQWISPHRLLRLEDVFWYPEFADRSEPTRNRKSGDSYLVRNDYQPSELPSD